MADLNVIYRIAADITGLQDGVKRAADATEGLEATVGRVGKAIVAAFSVGQVLEFGRITTQAFAEEEAALRRLETALIAQGTHTPALTKQYSDLAAQFQRTTAFSDDLVMEMQALLVQVGNVMPSQMEAALRASANLASGLGIDLRTATLLVGKAFEGETGTLKRYGIVIDETKLKTGGVSTVLDAINQKFGGQAQAAVETYSGKLAQFNNNLNDSQESIGGVLTQGLTPMLGLFNKLPGPIQAVVGGVSALSPSLDTLVLGLLAVGGPAKAGAMAATALGGLTAAATALWPVVAVGATAFTAWKLGEWIGEITGVTDAIEWLTGRLMGLSSEQIAASRAAREHAEDLHGLAGALDAVQKKGSPLQSLVPPLKAVGMTAEEATETIKEMEAQLRTSNAQARAREAEEKKRADAAKERAEQYRAMIRLNMDTQRAEYAQWARIQDAKGLREIQALSDEYQRNRDAEQAYAELVEANARAHREMLNEIGVLNMNAEAERMASLERQRSAWTEAMSSISQTISQNLAGALLHTQSFGEAFVNIWQGLKFTVLNMLSDLLNKFVNGFLNGMLKSITGSQGSFADAFGSSIGGAFSSVMNSIGKMFSGWLSTAASMVMQLMGGGKGGGMSTISGTAINVGSGLGTAAVGGALGIGGTAGTAVGIGSSIALGATTMGVGLAAVGVYKGIKALMGQAENKEVNKLRDAWFGGRGVQDLGDALGAKGVDGETARQLIEQVFNTERKDAFVAAAGTIDSILSGASRGIGMGMSFPALAKGGLVRQPTLAMIGESGPELVTPLDRLGSLGIGNTDEVVKRLDVIIRDLASDRRMQPHVMITAFRDALART